MAAAKKVTVGVVVNGSKPGARDVIYQVAEFAESHPNLNLLFEKRTGRPVTLACVQPQERPPADIELALYRILQEAFKNIEKYAGARHVTVELAERDSFVRLLIKDDGIGFDPELTVAKRKAKKRLGLLGMRERAGYVGGTLEVRSSHSAGTEIDVRIPLPKAIRVDG